MISYRKCVSDLYGSYIFICCRWGIQGYCQFVALPPIYLPRGYLAFAEGGQCVTDPLCLVSSSEYHILSTIYVTLTIIVKDYQ